MTFIPMMPPRFEFPHCKCCGQEILPKKAEVLLFIWWMILIILALALIIAFGVWVTEYGTVYLTGNATGAHMPFFKWLWYEISPWLHALKHIFK